MANMNLPLGLFDSFLSPQTMLILAIVAVLLYGERLPEVARSFGKQFMDFKKSIQGIREEFEAATRDVTSTAERPHRKEEPIDREEATAPKFEPPPSEPVSEPVAETH
jgi:sec-independent protein translocase protein TatA